MRVLATLVVLLSLTACERRREIRIARPSNTDAILVYRASGLTCAALANGDLETTPPESEFYASEGSFRALEGRQVVVAVETSGCMVTQIHCAEVTPPVGRVELSLHSVPRPLRLCPLSRCADTCEVQGSCEPGGGPTCMTPFGTMGLCCGQSAECLEVEVCACTQDHTGQSCPMGAENGVCNADGECVSTGVFDGGFSPPDASHPGDASSHPGDASDLDDGGTSACGGEGETCQPSGVCCMSETGGALECLPGEVCVCDATNDGTGCPREGGQLGVCQESECVEPAG